MKGLRRISRLDRAALAVVLLDLLLMLLLGKRALGLVLLLLFVGWVFFSLWLVTTLLVVRHRRQLDRLWLWVVLIGVGWLADRGVGASGALGGTLTAISALVFFCISWAITLGAVIMLFKYDLGVRIVGLLSLALVWLAALMLFREPDIIGAIVVMIQTNARSLVWLFSWLAAAAWIILPLALISFGWHTLVIIGREIRDASMTTAEYRRRRAEQHDPARR